MAKSDAESRFQALATVIVAARQDHLLTQGALARSLKVSQQSVSRWEAGTHRPSVDQIPGLAAALELDPAELRLVAGYATSASPRAPHFPFDRLASETFEQVVADLLKAQHPEAEVRIEGARGHDQSGIDVRALFGDRQWVVQCKQVARFGPVDVAKAIAAVPIEADRKILALSRIASPRAAEVARKAPGWEIWDQDDISRMIRSLPGGDQDRIADTYFPGQRMALLGRRESAPWLTDEQFFAPFAKPGAYFNHEWELRGRDRELEELSGALGKERVTLLIAAGGMGKSRLLRAAFERSAPSSTIVRFLSAARDPSRESLENLGVGDKLLVVDDAHDRDGLSVIIEYAADLRNRTKLLLATRPYALQRLENELGRFGYEKIRRIELGRLSRNALEAIVGEVLETNGVGRHWAEPVAAIAGENPLIATMAARVVASGDISLAEARGDEVLRHFVLSRFADVITGTIGDGGDTALLRAMLDLVAVMQPVHLNDRRLGELLEATTEFSAAQASRALKILVKGGVIYKRGAAYRLMPDVLGDYLIDESCVEEDGSLTLFAEKVIDAVGREHLEQVMVNLGRMDWRRNQGDPANSRLLDRAWERLDGVEHSWDPRFGAVRAVAMYQPRQALAYVQRHLRSKEVARELTPILRNVAFTPEYRLEVCRLLWEMGRDDDRPLGQHPNHAIRVLAELCGFGEYKPREISAEVAEFAFGLIVDDNAWGHHYSPLDILEPLLSGVVEVNRDHGRSFSLGRYFLDYDYALPLRSRVIDCVLSLLSHSDSSVAVRAARLLDDILRMPMGIGSQGPDEKLRAKYNAEFASTLEKLRERVASGGLAAATMITAVQGIEWHARFNEGRLSLAARAVFDALPETLAFRLRAAMVDGAQRAFRGQLDYEEWSTDNPWLDDLVAELRRTFGTPGAVLTEVSVALTELKQASVNQGAAYMLVSKLVEDDLDAAQVLLDLARDPSSEWRPYAYTGVREILERSPERGRAIVAAALDADERDPDLAQCAISAMAGLRRALTPADVSLLRRGVSSRQEVVLISSLNAIQWDRSLTDETAFDLLMLAPLDAGQRVFGAVAHHLEDRQRKLLRLLRARDVEAMLGQLRQVRQLPEGHWTEELFRHLATSFPLQFARFLLARADDALGEEGEVELLGYRYHEGKLGFDKSPAASETLALAWNWLLGHRDGDGYTIYRVVGMFACMFDIDARVVVDFLDAKIDTASPIELRLIGRLLRHTHHFFAFREQPFVERLLDRVAAADPGELDDVRDSLAAAAYSGMKSGVRGEPMPRDIEAKAKAEDVLSRLSRFSPAYPLYEGILKDAEADIVRAVQEGEMLDELE
jgi:transcriptional regulator with XRE-family HTH domain